MELHEIDSQVRAVFKAMRKFAGTLDQLEETLRHSTASMRVLHKELDSIEADGLYTNEEKEKRPKWAIPPVTP